jgi:hypothetical protein
MEGRKEGMEGGNGRGEWKELRKKEMKGRKERKEGMEGRKARIEGSKGGREGEHTLKEEMREGID